MMKQSKDCDDPQRLDNAVSSQICDTCISWTKVCEGRGNCIHLGPSTLELTLPEYTCGLWRSEDEPIKSSGLSFRDAALTGEWIRRLGSDSVCRDHKDGNLDVLRMGVSPYGKYLHMPVEDALACDWVIASTVDK